MMVTEYACWSVDTIMAVEESLFVPCTVRTVSSLFPQLSNCLALPPSQWSIAPPQHIVSTALQGGEGDSCKIKQSRLICEKC